MASDTLIVEPCMKNAKLKSEIFLIVKKSLCLVHDIGAVLCVKKKKIDYANCPAGGKEG